MTKIQETKTVHSEDFHPGFPFLQILFGTYKKNGVKYLDVRTYRFCDEFVKSYRLGPIGCFCRLCIQLKPTDTDLEKIVVDFLTQKHPELAVAPENINFLEPIRYQKVECVGAECEVCHPELVAVHKAAKQEEEQQQQPPSPELCYQPFQDVKMRSVPSVHVE